MNIVGLNAFGPNSNDPLQVDSICVIFWVFKMLTSTQPLAKRSDRLQH